MGRLSRVLLAALAALSMSAGAAIAQKATLPTVYNTSGYLTPGVATICVDLAGVYVGCGAGGGGGSTSVTANAVSPTWVEGSTTNALNATLKGGLRVTLFDTAGAPIDFTAASPVTKSGTWTLDGISGTISLPTGAATAAKQPALGTAGTASTDVLSVQGIASMTPLLVNGSGVTQPVSGTVSATISGTATVSGPAADAAAASGNPLRTGCQADTAVATVYTTGQMAAMRCNAKGMPYVSVVDSNLNTLNWVTMSIDDRSATAGPAVTAIGVLYDNTGNVIDKMRSVKSTDTTLGDGVMATAVAPHTSAGGAITPIVSTAAEGSRVLKASAGNLYRLVVNTGATAGFVMVINATSAPADGAVTPHVCRAVAASSQVELDFSGMPARFGTGITAVFSSGADCFTKTASATARFEGYAQ